MIVMVTERRTEQNVNAHVEGFISPSIKITLHILYALSLIAECYQHGGKCCIGFFPG
jgi:hypothetical protein